MKKVLPVVFSFVFLFTLMTSVVFAQDVIPKSQQPFGGTQGLLDSFGKAVDLGTDAGRPQNVYVTVGRVIQGVISLSGVIALGFIIYGGTLFVTGSKGQGGTKEDVAKARQIIGAAVVGLLLLIASYVIADFVIQAVIRATTQV